MSKMGRPKIESPRIKKVNIRLTQEEYDELMEYASQHNLTITQLILKGIDLLIHNPE